jgi:hypothetical protein
VSVSRFEVIRFRSVGSGIARALGIEPPPDCRIAHGRATLTFRRLGATRWPEAQQIDYAVRAVNVARAVLADDTRRQVRRAAQWATVVVYEDATSVDGCAVVARWECVVPAESSRYR